MIRVAIIGAKGYAGKELLGLALRHKEMEVVALMDLVEKSEPVSEIFPEFRHLTELAVEPTKGKKLIEKVEAVFLALPHRVSQEYAGEFLRAGKLVIDLSADFRFSDIRTYEATYATEHKEKGLAREAVYGLAEINREKIRQARLIAVPGCYPAGALLGLAPLIMAGIKIKSPLIVDAKSGVSGAGRTPTEMTHFPECNESLQAYAVGGHRHQPEIEEKVRELCGGGLKDVKIIFTPHLIPINRGILSTIYAFLADDIPEEQIREIYLQQYEKEFFIRLMPQGRFPATKNVAFTNFCDIGFQKVKEHLLIIITAIDNLVKGAAGQAVQCFNICYSLPEKMGLI